MLSCRSVPIFAAIALASLRAADAFTSPLPMAAARRPLALSSQTGGVKVAGVTLGGKVRGGAAVVAMALFGESIVSGVDASVAKKACACGSGMTYAECCEPHHNDDLPPRDPVALIRARYSAYAYTLPDFLMRTTEKGSPEYSSNTEKWEKELLNFCQSYQFENANGGVLGVGIEECSYVGKTDRAFVQFNARMLGQGQKMVEFWERSRVRRKDGRWYYSKGSLLEYEGPLY